MAAFAYQAVDAAGKTAKGIIEASNAAAARQSLRARRLMPVSVTPTTQKNSAAPSILPKSRIPRKALTLFTRQLATLIGSGIGVEQALKTVADQTTQPAVASLLLNLRAAVLDGRSFAQALGDYPHVFGDFYRASVAAGESSGQLDNVMEHLSAFVETRAKNRQKVQLALLYPAILAAVSVAVIIALLTFVVPDIVRVFTSRGADLPFLTQALISTSDFLNRWGLILLATLISLVFIGGALLRKPWVRMGWHRFLATSRLTRHFVLKSNAAQFTGTLATLTVSRVPLVEALAASAATVPNLFVREKVNAASAKVREGTALSKAIAQSAVFPPMLIAMISSGEAGGTLGGTLQRAADDQSRDLDAIVTALVALVEPAVLLLMGGIVMLLVMAIMLPIVNLNNLVG